MERLGMSAAAFLIEELRQVRVAAELSQEDLGKLINYSGSHVSAVENGTRAPKADYIAAVDRGLNTHGIFTRMLKRLASLDAAPPWLRNWILFEREAVALRWYEPAYVPGLLQTEAYAKATLAEQMLPPEKIEEIVAARLDRQSILVREHPPLLIAVMDELALRRRCGSDHVMLEQLTVLAERGQLPNVQIHVVPAGIGMYPGLAGGFIIAEARDGERVAHADSALAAHIVDGATEVATLGSRWEQIRSEAHSAQQSLDLIMEAAASWK